MARLSQEDRSWRYYAETEGFGEPSIKDFERGKRLAEGLQKIRDSFLGLDDEHLSINWWSINGTRMIVIPKFPVEREVNEVSRFNTYLSVRERTASDTPLVISSFSIVRNELVQTQGPLFINGSSPTYRVGRNRLEVEESFRNLDILPHQIAVLRK